MHTYAYALTHTHTHTLTHTYTIHTHTTHTHTHTHTHIHTLTHIYCTHTYTTHTHTHTHNSTVEEADVASSSFSEVDNSAALTQSFNKPSLRPPIPSVRPLSPSSSPPPMVDEVLYDDPKVITRHSSKFEESIEEVYDNIEEANAIHDLNKFPPPVWKKEDNLQPPPLPPSHPCRRYTRTFDQSSDEFVMIKEWSTAKNQLGSPKSSGSPKSPGSCKAANVSKGAENKSPKSNNKKHFGSLRDTHRVTTKQKVKTKPPIPPAKTRKCGSTDDLLNATSSELKGEGGEGLTAGLAGRGIGFNLKNDPKFGKRLQERRQEIYDDNDRSRPKSWGHEQERYEELAFSASDDDLLSSGDGGNPPGVWPRSDESDDEYVDCQPQEDEEPQDYLDFETAREGHQEKKRKGPNTLKREEFLKRPPLPLPAHSSAGNPISQPPLAPKVPVGGRALIGPAAASFAPRPAMSSTGSDSPPPIPRRGNERPPLPAPPSGAEEEDDEAPPVPRRHPQASDKHRARAVPEHTTTSSPSRGSPANNTLPLPPRSVSPVSPPSSMSSDVNAPPIPHRGKKQLDTFSPPAAAAGHSLPPSSFMNHIPKPNYNKGPLPLPRQRSQSPEDFSAPLSDAADNVFEDFTFGKGPLSLPSSLPPESLKERNRTKANPPVPSKNRLKKESYETQLPPDIGMRPPVAKKKLPSYEVNLPPSIGNRPPKLQPPPSTKPGKPPTKPPTKPPIATKPPVASSPHVGAKPQVSKKPIVSAKPPIVTPKPAAATMNHKTNAVASQSKANFNTISTSDPSRQSNREATNSQAGGRPAVRTRNVAPKPHVPVPPIKPKPHLPPPAMGRRKPVPTPSMY